MNRVSANAPVHHTGPSMAGPEGVELHASPPPASHGTDPSPLQPVIFSTDLVEPRSRLDLWQSKYESFNTIVPTGSPGPSFSDRNVIWSFGALALSRNTAPGVSIERSTRQIRRDSIDHWVLRVARTGASRYRSASACFVTSPGLLALFSLGEPSESDRTNADWLSLYIPRDAFPDLSMGLAALGAGVLETPGAALLADYLLLLERRLSAMTPEQVPVLATATRSMIAACLLAGIAPGTVSPADKATARMERIRHVIRQNIGRATLDPQKICSLAGVSRSNLYRLFEPHGGVAHYIQGQRLRMAHAMLSEPGCRASVAEIGERLGFFDASAFSRVFRREFGYTPGEARAAGQQGLRATGVETTCSTSCGLDFGGLLRRLAVGDRREALPPA